MSASSRKPSARGAGREAVDVYRGHGHGGDSPGAVWNAVMADRVFRMPAIRLAEAREKSGDQGATYLYEFTWPAAMLGGILGACHGVEIPFAFANLRGPGVELFLGQVDEEIDALAAATSGAWLSVAHSGDPAVPLLPEWPTYDTDRRATMQLGATCTVVDDPDGARRDFWSGVL